jgi:hypothetical protein
MTDRDRFGLVLTLAAGDFARAADEVRTRPIRGEAERREVWDVAFRRDVQTDRGLGIWDWLLEQGVLITPDEAFSLLAKALQHTDLAKANWLHAHGAPLVCPDPSTPSFLIQSVLWQHVDPGQSPCIEGLHWLAAHQAPLNLSPAAGDSLWESLTALGPNATPFLRFLLEKGGSASAVRPPPYPNLTEKDVRVGGNLLHVLARAATPPTPPHDPMQLMRVHAVDYAARPEAFAEQWELLEAAGADPQAEDGLGRTALDLAQQSPLGHIVALRQQAQAIRAHRAPGSTPRRPGLRRG